MRSNAILACGLAAISVAASGSITLACQMHSRNVPPASSPIRLRVEEQVRLEQEAMDAWKIDHDYTRTEKLFKESDALIPSSATAFTTNAGNLGDMMAEQGRSREAFIYYAEVMHNPIAGIQRSPERLFRYAELAEQFHQPKESIMAYEELINKINKIDPPTDRFLLPSATNDPAKLRAAAYVAMGWYKRNTSGEKNFDTLRKGVNMQPRMAIGHLCLALALREKSRNGEAKLVLQRAEQLSNSDMRKFIQQLR